MFMDPYPQTVKHKGSGSADDAFYSNAGKEPCRERLGGLIPPFVLLNMPAESSYRAPCSHARLRRLAAKTREKCGPEHSGRNQTMVSS
jgi:hypothetical protein